MSFFPPGKIARQEQKDAVEKIEGHFASGKKIVAFQGPTGVGKSYIGMTLARQTAGRGETTHLLSVQKNLQDQYSAEFTPPMVEPMKGRSNYSCTYDPAISKNAARGYCRRVKKSSLIQKCLKLGTVEEALKFELPAEAHLCPYWGQMQRTMEAPIALFNFHSFLFQQRLGRFGTRDFMIIDECHNAEGVLMQFVEIILSDEALAKIGIRLDLTIQNTKDLSGWLERERVEERIFEKLGSAVNSEDAAEGLSPEETDRLRALLERLEMLTKFLDMTDWIVDVTEEPSEEDPKDFTRKLRVRPVFISLFARELLFSKAERTLAMSATILDPKIWARNLGLKKDEIAYVEAPCVFPVSNRPIITEYAGNMAWETQEATLPAVFRTVSKILERHKGERGIIHGHSERICKLIVEAVKSPRFLHLDMFEMRDKSALLKAHLAKPDSVIVGSGFHEGIDLKDDLARFQIIAKVPWPGMGDKLVKARMAADGSYLPYQTALKLVQSYGRAVRHKDDWAITYMIDSGFEGFLNRCGWLLPKWFTEAVQKPKPHVEPMF